MRSRLLNSRPFPAFCKMQKDLRPTPVTGALHTHLEPHPESSKPAAQLLTAGCDGSQGPTSPTTDPPTTDLTLPDKSPTP
jgi:hypothetical protein